MKRRFWRQTTEICAVSPNGRKTHPWKVQVCLFDVFCILSLWDSCCPESPEQLGQAKPSGAFTANCFHPATAKPAEPDHTHTLSPMDLQRRGLWDFHLSKYKWKALPPSLSTQSCSEQCTPRCWPGQRPEKATRYKPKWWRWRGLSFESYITTSAHVWKRPTQQPKNDRFRCPAPSHHSLGNTEHRPSQRRSPPDPGGCRQRKHDLAAWICCSQLHNIQNTHGCQASASLPRPI